MGGSCGTYSNNLELTIEQQSSFTKQIILNSSVTTGTVDLDWTLNFNSDLGYKVVISESPNPVYPGNTYHYISNPLIQDDTWTGLSSGTYYFRVCEYLGGSCGTYSNNLEVIVP